VPVSGLGRTPEVNTALPTKKKVEHSPLTKGSTSTPLRVTEGRKGGTFAGGMIASTFVFWPADCRQNTVPVGKLPRTVKRGSWIVTSKIVPSGQPVGIAVGGVLVIVQVRCCPATIVPLQSLLNEVVKPASPVSVTLNAPGPNVTSVPVAEPAKLGGFGLLAVTCIVKLAGVAVVVPFTIFMTVNVAVVGVGVGVGDVLLAIV